jgi:hypothetical protein
MKQLLFFFLLASSIHVRAQTADSILVQRAALDYIEGFYEGDTVKLQRALSPTLFKYGYYKSETGEYAGEPMTYAEAIAYAKRVFEKKRFAKPDAPKEVFVLDVQAHIACVKIHAWWGLDYVLLARKGNAWIIEQVLWQGPLNTINR